MSSTSPGRLGGLAATAALVAAVLVPASASAEIMDAHLAFTGDTTTTMAVTFKETAAVSGTTATAYARPVGAGGAAACAAAPGPTGCISIALTRSDVPGRDATGTVNTYTFFTGTFSGLTPGATYDWFINDSVTTAGVTPGTFKTARGGNTTYTAATYGEVHTDDGDDVVAFGASGPGNYSVQGVVGLQAADRTVWNQDTRPAFVVSSGDNMNDGNMEHRWDDLLAGNTASGGNGTTVDTTFIRTVRGSIPFMNALGDHEYKNITPAGTASPLYYAHSPNPGNGPSGQEKASYSYDYNGVHWVVLEASPGNKPSSFPQYWANELRWLDADLAAAVTRTRFQIVVMHQPPFHSKTSRVYPSYADPEFRDDVMPIFDKYGVEAVVSGHDAHNVRSFPLVGTPTEDWAVGKPRISPELVEPGHGTTYLEQSTTGKNYDGLLDREPWVAWSQTQETMPAVLLFTFGAKSVGVRFVRTDALDPVTNQLLYGGGLVDSFTIKQVPPAGTEEPSGPQGPKGDSGEQGPKGDAGANGAAGTNGTNGTKGDSGAAGAKGDAGAKGETGAAGAKGDQGERGPAGAAAKVTCSVKRGKGAPKVSCKVTSASKSTSKQLARSNARLVRGGRTYATGTAATLKSRRTVTRGSYTLRVTAGKRVLAFPVRIR
ncbi:metallophosphoesterase [Conexibacter sp. JD483]|uniref:metallophosphoesterase family protein n=1 Tax=unclassified Conexibacter TaxID=2627773 RepID=UPI00271D8891|nr:MULTISPECIES: metallophosphoesterase [unclassified Conexibacter]MDO8184031.1 metallophosphoesterase [Conexibacter sp. CPCC 205706]MDO8197023.1 metallophosphoesterase [Conexibacter sp. CPCC 205762]MDR9367939.1 metallophosphoesterase [Conexibacter sp. JD483]